MKSLNLALLLFLSGFGMLSAQNIAAIGMSPTRQCTDDLSNQIPAPYSQTHIATRQNYLNSVQNNAAGSRAVTTVPIGTAGNLFTIIDAAVNSLAANNELNTVSFIHRTDPSVYPSNNVGQYRYDVSVDGGQTWSIDNGLLNPSGNQLTLAGRFPQAVIHNPLNNTNPDNAYLSYQGTWLPFDQNGDWDGLFTGVARLNNDTATFTENVLNPYNNDITVATGLCNGTQNVFWSVSFAAADGIPTSSDSIILYKGVFNTSTNDVQWGIDRFLVPGFDKSFDGDTYASGLNMAFDPTGQFGWIVFLGDVTTGGENTLNPVFYKTANGGQSWQGPITVDLASLQNVVDSLSPSGSGIPTTAFDCDIVVDKNGNPHIGVVIGSSSDYAISTNQSGSNIGLLRLYDITFNKNSECGWEAVFLSDIATFRGEITAQVSEDNRPQASLSPDGSKVFISWLDSDPGFTGGSNEIPNFHTIGLDVDQGLATNVVNWTQGDPVWDGGALFGTMAQDALEPTNGTYNLPVIFTRLNASGSDGDPASFHYVQDISYEDADFTIDYEAPEVALNGTNPLTIQSGGTFNDPGITANDNVDGTISGAGITVIDSVDENTPGQYTVTYSATDVAGNTSCELVRVVNVVGSPDNIPPVITLPGNDTIEVESCAFFVAPEATASDNIDGDITSNIVVTSNVDTGVVGTYTVDYDVTDGAGNAATTVTLVVEVVSSPPTIALNGPPSISTEVCLGFNDPGATASDACGPTNVTVSSTPPFNIDSTGTYTLTYTADDGNNPPVSVNRTVTVTPDATGPDFTLLGDNPDLAYLGESYNDPGVIAEDCVEGIVAVDTVTSANTTARDTVQVEYSATDGTNSNTATRTVYVNTEPDPDFTFTVTDGTVNLTDASRYNPTSWTWTVTGQTLPIRTTQNAAYTFSAVGTYEVCLEVANEWNTRFNVPEKQVCKDIEITNVISGINDIDLNKIFKLYPNPTDALLNINYSSNEIENMNITVFNTIGKEILTEEYTKATGSGNIVLNLSGNANGIYFVRIQTDKGAITKRVNLMR